MGTQELVQQCFHANAGITIPQALDTTTAYRQRVPLAQITHGADIANCQLPKNYIIHPVRRILIKMAGTTDEKRKWPSGSKLLVPSWFPNPFDLNFPPVPGTFGESFNALFCTRRSRGSRILTALPVSQGRRACKTEPVTGAHQANLGVTQLHHMGGESITSQGGESGPIFLNCVDEVSNLDVSTSHRDLPAQVHAQALVRQPGYLTAVAPMTAEAEGVCHRVKPPSLPPLSGCLVQRLQQHKLDPLGNSPMACCKPSSLPTTAPLNGAKARHEYTCRVASQHCSSYLVGLPTLAL